MENTLQNSMSSNLEDYMMQKKIEIMMDMANKKIVSELNNINSMIGKLNEEIVEIKRQLNEGRGGVKIKPAVVNESRISQEEVSAKSIKNNEQPLKPRYGDYTPEDVKIDKFFYFGNKKL